MSASVSCCVADTNCLQPANGPGGMCRLRECYRCGEPVCVECSTIVPYTVANRDSRGVSVKRKTRRCRLCNNCVEEMNR